MGCGFSKKNQIVPLQPIQITPGAEGDEPTEKEKKRRPRSFSGPCVDEDELNVRRRQAAGRRRSSLGSNSLETALDFPLIREYLFKYAKSTYTEDNLQCYLLTCKYRQTPEGGRRKLMDDICKNFIVPGAPFEVPLYDMERMKIITSYGLYESKKSRVPDVNLFNGVQNELFFQIRDDTWPKFSKSKIYGVMMQDPKMLGLKSVVETIKTGQRCMTPPKGSIAIGANSSISFKPDAGVARMKRNSLKGNNSPKP